MECLNCHAALAEAAKFCSECGTPLRSPARLAGMFVALRRTSARSAGRRLAAARRRHRQAPPASSSPQDSAGEHAERRQLTVLFCDLIGSTEMSAQLDPEDLRVVIGAYHRCVAETVAQFDGFVARFLGDGALVYFGYPHGHEDNAAARRSRCLGTRSRMWGS